MASSSFSSKSILTEQTALSCQLCEDEPKIKWKCLECKILMCQRCKKKVHPKFPTADDHNIIDIKDLGKHEEEKKPDFTKLTCAQHEGQNCCLFCKTCVELVCPLCIANKHKKHDLVELQEGYQIQVENIRNGQSKIIEGITIQATYKDRLKQLQYLHQLSYDRTKQDILDKENALHIAVKKQTNKLLHELDRKWKDTSQSLDFADKQVDENQKTLLEQNDKVNNMIQSDDVKYIFNISDVLWKSMETNIKPVNTTFNSSKFVPGKKVEISILFGTLDNVSIQQNTDLKVRTSYSTELKHITKIISSHDDLHYSLGTSLNNLQKVKLTRDTIKVKSDLVLESIDMALTSSEDLIILNKDSSKIKIIPSGTLDVKDSVYSVSPLLPLGVHVTHDNKAIVRAGDTESRLVIVMDQAVNRRKYSSITRTNSCLHVLAV